MRGEDELARLLGPQAETMQAARTTIREADSMPDADYAVTARPTIKRMMQEAIPETFRQGISGWLDDDLAFVRPWGFDLSTIQVPVLLWRGADDVLVPRSHGDWLAEHIETAELRELEGGHAAVVDRFVELLETLFELGGGG